MWSTLIRSEPEVDDGWDEDEDDFQDDDEDDLDVAASSGENQNEPINHQNGAPGSPSSSPAVGGVFMGRLTRFLEQVTQPENEEGEEDYDDEDDGIADEDGWGDADDIDLVEEPDEPMEDGFVEERIDDPVEESPQEPSQQGGWAASMVQGIRSAAASATQPSDDNDPGDLVDEEEGEDENSVGGQEHNNGWGDDDDAFEMSDSAGDSPQLSKQLNSIETYGGSLEQPLNNLLEEIREIDERQTPTGATVNDTGFFTADELADVALMPLADISEVDQQPDKNYNETTKEQQAQERQAEDQPPERQGQHPEGQANLPHTDSFQRPIDQVLNEIEVQERKSLVQRVLSQEEDPNDSDLAEVLEHNHDQAVLAIQQELEAVGDAEGMLEETETEKRKNSSGNIIDHTPIFPANNGADPSLDPQLESEDRTRDANPRAVDGIAVSNGDEDVYEDENEDDFGPVVDHTPKESVAAPSTAVSLVVQATDWIQDMDADDAMDETVDEGWLGDELDDLDEVEDEIKNQETPNQPAVVDHTPLEDDNRTRSSKVADPSVIALRSEMETLGEDMIEGDENEGDQLEFGPVVDHLPPTEKPVASASQSLAVNAPALEQEFREDDAMDETVVAGGEESIVDGELNAGGRGKVDESTDVAAGDGWDDEEESANEKHATLPPLEPYAVTVSDNHVVDHTPSELNFNPQSRPNDPSVAVLATGEDLTRDTGMGSNEDVYDDENEMAYVPVVDHTPGPSESVLSSYNSVAAHATSVDVGDEGMDDTLFGDSTIAGGTLDGGTLDGGGWDHEDPILEEESLSQTQDSTAAPAPAPGENMVDHTPSEMGPMSLVKASDPSVAVLASIDENDNDSAVGTQVYGPVVDHTPTTPAPQPPTRSDSVIAQINDVDTDVDETLVGGSTIGEEAEGDEEDTVEDEVPSALPSEANLVDRVPARPEQARFGDASTVVAADASEMLSAVDDMEEAGDFGLVVDQTPPAVPAMQQRAVSGAGSTVVFAPPSVATDDLDPDETDANADDWGDNDQAASEDAAPNPQSGNDEPVLNEQLVDFLPPQNAPPVLDEEGEPSTEASSEFAVGGAQSLLLPEDQKEDDFGPVVDLTPVPRNLVAQSVVSATSTGSIVTSTEIGRMLKDDKAEARSVDESANGSLGSKPVVDHVPNNIRELRNADSLATVGQSQFTDEEDEEEETDSKFGPVVDHLPTPRASTVASRGGSTIDALGTVSEGDSVEEAGWADDLDMDTSVGAASALTDRVSQAQSATKGLFRRSTTGDSERNMSVKWDSTVRDTNTSPSQNDSDFADARQASIISQDTKYYDANSSEGGWSGKVPVDVQSPKQPGASFAEADTPPSTPHHRPPKGVRQPQQYGASWLDISGLDSNSCANTSADVSDAECACLKRLLKVTKEAGTMYGTLVAADGKTVQVDFGQILHDEMVKRRLVEEEARALRELVENQKRARAEATEPLEREMKTLRKSNDDLSSTLSRLQKESDQYKQENGRRSEEMNSMSRLVDEMKEQRAELETKLGEVTNENMRIADELSQSAAKVNELEKGQSEAATDRQSFVDKTTKTMDVLKSDLLEKDQKIEQLKTQVHQLEMNLDEIKYSNNQLSDKLSASQRDRDALKDEVVMLHGELEISQQAGDQASADSELIAMLKAEKMASAETCRSLAIELDDLKKNLRSEQENSSTKLEESRQQVGELEQKLVQKDTECNDLNLQVSTLKSSVDSLQSECDKVEDEAIKLSLEIQEERQKRRTSESKACKLEEKLSEAQETMASNDEKHKLLVADLEGKIADGSESWAKMEDEITILKSNLQEAEQEKASKTEESEALMNSLKEDLTNKNMECTKLSAAISSIRDQMQNRQETLSRLSQEKKDLIVKGEQEMNSSKAETQKLQLQIDTLQANLDAATEDHANREAELSAQIRKLDSMLALRDSELTALSQQTSKTEHNFHEAAAGQQQLRTQLAIAEGKVQMAEQKLTKALSDSKSDVEALSLQKSNLEGMLSKKEAQLKMHLESQNKSQEELRSADSQRQQLQTRLAITEGKLHMVEKKLSEGASNSMQRLKTLEREKSAVAAELEEKKAALDSLQQQVENAAVTHDELRNELALSQAEVDSITQSMSSKDDAYKSEVIALKGVIDSKEKALKGLLNKVDQIRSEKTAAEAELSSQHHALTAENENLGRSLSALQQERDGLRKKLSNLEADRSEKINLERSHLDESESLKTMLTRAEEQSSQLQSKLDTTRDQIKAMEAEAANSSRIVESLSSGKAAAESSLSQLQAELDSRFEEHSRSSELVTTLQEECRQLRTQLEYSQASTNNLSEAERIFQASLAESQKMLGQASSERDALAEENEELLVQLGLLKEDMDASDEHAAQVENDLHNLELIAEQFMSVGNGNQLADGSAVGVAQKTSIALQTLQARVSELETSLKLAESEKQRLAANENGHEKSAAAISSLERRCQELERQLTTKQVELDRLSRVEYDAKLAKSKMGELQASFDRLHVDSIHQSKTINDKDAQIASAESRLAEVLRDDKVVETLNQRIRDLESEARAAQRRAEQSEDEYKRYQAQVTREDEKTTSSAQSMKQEIEDLRTQLESATKSLRNTQAQQAQKEVEMQQEIHALAAELRNPRLHEESPIPEPPTNLAGDVEELKAQIVSLAMALERSESRRAEAMDLLQLERQANADSLRRLGESVKRFYSSVYPSGNGES